jgi:hypothetical protein
MWDDLVLVDVMVSTFKPGSSCGARSTSADNATCADASGHKIV